MLSHYGQQVVFLVSVCQHRLLLAQRGSSSFNQCFLLILCISWETDDICSWHGVVLLHVQLVQDAVKVA